MPPCHRESNDPLSFVIQYFRDGTLAWGEKKLASARPVGETEKTRLNAPYTACQPFSAALRASKSGNCLGSSLEELNMIRPSRSMTNALRLAAPAPRPMKSSNSTS